MPAAFAAAERPNPTATERARMIALLSDVFPLAQPCSACPSGPWRRSWPGWRASFLFIALVAIVALVLLSRLPATAPDGRTPRPQRGEPEVLSDRRASEVSWTFVWFAGSFGCRSMSVS